MAEKIRKSPEKSRVTSLPTGVGRRRRNVPRMILLSLLAVMVFGFVLMNLVPSTARPVAIAIGAMITFSGSYSTYNAWNRSGRKFEGNMISFVLPFIMIVVGTMVIVTQLLG